jgi:hypothetical protein
MLKSLIFSSSGGRQLSCQREVNAIRSTLFSPSLTLLTEDYIHHYHHSKQSLSQSISHAHIIYTVCPSYNSLIYSLNAQGHTKFSKVHPMNLAVLAGGLQSMHYCTSKWCCIILVYIMFFLVY